jgi:hypothetical protein
MKSEKGMMEKKGKVLEIKENKEKEEPRTKIE